VDDLAAGTLTIDLQLEKFLGKNNAFRGKKVLEAYSVTENENQPKCWGTSPSEGSFFTKETKKGMGEKTKRADREEGLLRQEEEEGKGQTGTWTMLQTIQEGNQKKNKKRQKKRGRGK